MGEAGRGGGVMFHRHKWQLLGASHSDPPTTLTKLVAHPDMDGDIAYSAMFGLSVVTQQCEVCGRTESYTVPGNTGIGGE